MAKLILLVVAAIWAAVLIPPLLRSRLENRPNSSVVDFRRQLAKLQSSSQPHRSMRAMGRPLTAAPRQRAPISAISSRDVSRGDMLVRRAPVEPMRHSAPGERRRHGQFERSHTDGRAQQPMRTSQRWRDQHDAPEQFFEDGAPAAHRPEHGHRRQHGSTARAAHRETRNAAAPRGHRSRPAAAPRTAREELRRRRTNVTAALFVLTAGTLFLYATTKSDVMMYGFAVAFLAFCGYVYLLSQQRQREAAPWSNDRWLNG